MIRSALKTSTSHSSDYSIVRLMGRVTNEHLARLDLRENLSTPSDSITPIPRLGQGLWMSSQSSLRSTPHSCDTKTWPHSEKTLAQQNDQGQVLEGQRLRMLYELGAWHPQPWALSRESTSWKTLVLVFMTMNLYGGVHEITSQGQHRTHRAFLDRFPPRRIITLYHVFLWLIIHWFTGYPCPSFYIQGVWGYKEVSELVTTMIPIQTLSLTCLDYKICT
jgi:hypothetical protein